MLYWEKYLKYGKKNLNIKAKRRGHNLIYIMESFKSRRRNDYAFFVGERHSLVNFFVNRVAPIWNLLPSNVINSSSLNGFKVALDKFTENGHLSI